ncbi:MAG: hypothetical protein ACHQE5_08550, partial [Actinomycetes bacterium]
MSDESTTSDGPVAGEESSLSPSTGEAAAAAGDAATSADKVDAAPPPAPPLRQQASGRTVGKVR